MKTLNKKHLKIINDLICQMRCNENCIATISKKDIQPDEEKTFANYLFWHTRAVSIKLYEDYGISYFSLGSVRRNLARADFIKKEEDEAYKQWKSSKRRERDRLKSNKA